VLFPDDSKSPRIALRRKANAVPKYAFLSKPWDSDASLGKFPEKIRFPLAMAEAGLYPTPMRSADPWQINLDKYFGKVKYRPNGELPAVI
jgi:hypothetical protein